jgi:hypothetical protein
MTNAVFSALTVNVWIVRDSLSFFLRLLPWRETKESFPEDFVIGIAHSDGSEVVLSIRMTPPKSLVPETKLLEFDLAFEL